MPFGYLFQFFLSRDRWSFFLLTSGHQMCLQKLGQWQPGVPEYTVALLSLLGQSLDPPQALFNNV